MQGGWKSEALIVAKNSGNAGGAKERRCEKADEANMPRH
jgi:hypothetical protein